VIHSPRITKLVIEHADGSTQDLAGTVIGFDIAVEQVVDTPSAWVPGSQQTYAQIPAPTVESHADGQHWRTTWRVSGNPQEHP
jgi:hypothetical protein